MTEQSNLKTEAEYRAMAQQCRDERAASWERSDTDGFLSQWEEAPTPEPEPTTPAKSFEVKVTGFDSASMIPVGATLTAADWYVPDTYTEGTRYETRRDALAAAIAKWESVASSVGYTRSFPVTIDLRWKFDFPEGQGGLSTVAQRWVYPTLEDARRGLQVTDWVEANR
jgi:hypothetical protein